MQQEKVRKDIRKNFLGEKKKEKKKASQSPSLQAVKYSLDKPISGVAKVYKASEQADGLGDALAAQSNNHRVQSQKTWHKRAAAGKAAWQRDRRNGITFTALWSCTSPVPDVIEQSLSVQDYI